MITNNFIFVIADFIPAIYGSLGGQCMDYRDKPGYDKEVS